MRIVGHIDHDLYKITIMHMNNRYAVKFEVDGFEQTYKIREGNGTNTVHDIKNLINEKVILTVGLIFEKMKNLKIDMLNNLTGDENVFEEII